MKQKREQNIPTNAVIVPSEQVLTEINQDILDVQRCLNTNTVITKNTVRDTKQNKTNSRSKDDKKLKYPKDISQKSSKPEVWNDLKKHAPETLESIQNNAAKEITKVNEHISRSAKSAIQKSSEVICEGKHIISEKTPKVGNWISKSLRDFFGKKRSFYQRDLDLLKKLAVLRQEGILSSKEFALKKKQILEKL